MGFTNPTKQHSSSFTLELQYLIMRPFHPSSCFSLSLSSSILHLVSFQYILFFSHMFSFCEYQTCLVILILFIAFKKKYLVIILQELKENFLDDLLNIFNEFWMLIYLEKRKRCRWVMTVNIKICLI